jgi:hypothetical protein
MDLDQRRRNLLKVRDAVITQCRGKRWNPEACETEVQTLGWISWRLARLQDGETENVSSEEKEDTAYAIMPCQDLDE